MKTQHHSYLFSLLALAAMPSTGVAQTFLSWDVNPLLRGAQGGTSTWNTATSRWYNGTDNQTWTDGAYASFGSPSGTVTLNSTVTAAGLGFATDGYAITGTGTIVLEDSSRPIIGVTTGTSSINVILAGSNGLQKTVNGVLEISKPSPLGSVITISSGTLRPVGGTAIHNSSAVSRRY